MLSLNRTGLFNERSGIETPQDAKRMIDQTNVDGVMIGRAALANLWMIYRAVQHLETGELMSEPNACEKIDV